MRWARVRGWWLGQQAVAAGRDITGTVITGPVTVRVGGRVAQPVPGAAADALIGAYLDRLQARYGHLDIEALLPLTDQDERVPVGVREVFVPQTVRADPPPVELPRELWQRLAESGTVDPGELPKHLDREVLARVRRSYQARPARPVLEVLAEPAGRRMVVLGDPGSGKSTLARYLAVVLAAGSGPDQPAALAGWLPVLIELRSYAGPRRLGSSFLDYFDHQHHTDDGLGLPRGLLDRLLNDPGHVLVIFDGLDELFDPQAREAVTHQITGFAARHPRVRVLVTSRHVGYQRTQFDAAGFGHYMLQDLDRAQIAAFADRWYHLACSGNPADASRLRARLLAAIDGSRAVRELAGNPLLLTILAIIGRRRELPRDRLTVYEHAVAVLVEQWDVSKHLAEADPSLPPLDRRDKLELLRLIARQMQAAPGGLAGNHIAAPDLLAMFQTYLRDSHGLASGPALVAARAMVEQFRHRNFILSRFGGEVYGFVHRAFLEYLAAADIDIRFGDRELSEDDLIHGVFGRHWNDPAWHEVLLLLTGMREHFAGGIVDYLLVADPLWFLRPDTLPQHVLLAVRCLGETRKPGILAGRHTAISRALTGLLEIADDLPHQTAFVTAIGLAVRPVMTSLGPRWAGRDHYLAWYRIRGHSVSRSPLLTDDVVPLAAQIAAALDPGEAFRRHLHTTATLGDHEAVRRAAVEAIAAGWAADPGTLPLLRECATTDENSVVRWAAVRAIAAGWAADPGTLSWLRERAVADRYGDVREAAVEAIAAGWADDPGTLPLLRERAVDDTNEVVRRAAVRAVAAGWAADPGTLPLLREGATADRSEVVREAAVEAIAVGWATDPHTLPFVRVRADADEAVRRAAVEAIVAGWAGDPGVLSWLRGLAVADTDEFVRRAAVRAIAAGWAADPGTLPLLRERAADDANEVVRRAAVQAIVAGWAGDPGTLHWLRERAATDKRTVMRRIVLEAIAAGWADDPGTLPWLHERAIADGHRTLRLAAVEAIVAGWADDPGTLPLLRERATDDTNEIVRQAAVRATATGWAADPGTLPLLRERATADQNRDVRRVATLAIAAGWAADPGTLPLLRECATADHHWGVRRAAMDAIVAGWADDPGTLPLLRERAVADTDEVVRRGAMLTIAAGWADDPGTLPLLRERAVADQRGDVRRAAVQVMAAGWADDPGTLPLLRERAVDDIGEVVRPAAVRAIAAGWVTDPGTLPWLRERAVTDQHGDVRRAAVRAIAAGWAADPGTLPLLRDRAVADTDEVVRRAAAYAVAAVRPDDPDTR